MKPLSLLFPSRKTSIIRFPAIGRNIIALLTNIGKIRFPLSFSEIDNSQKHKIAFLIGKLSIWMDISGAVRFCTNSVFKCCVISSSAMLMRSIKRRSYPANTHNRSAFVRSAVYIEIRLCSDKFCQVFLFSDHIFIFLRIRKLLLHLFPTGYNSSTAEV